MTAPLGILTYAGRDPASAPSLAYRAWRLVVNLVVFAILLAVVIVRAALLASGFACVVVGTLPLTLGGRRGAAAKMRQWRERFGDLSRLWWGDLLRPLRRWREGHRTARAVPVLPAPAAPDVSPQS
jgi:hypothetical protein